MSVKILSMSLVAIMNERVRILIADDQRPTRDGLRALLSFMAQIEVVGEADNGWEAVLKIQKCQPHIVLMDMQMPIMDGLQTTELIKHYWPGVKVIALTIYPAYRAVALKAGADAFLLKGCAADLLKNTILQIAFQDRLIHDGSKSAG